MACNNTMCYCTVKSVIYRDIARFHGKFQVNKAWNIAVYLIHLIIDLVAEYMRMTYIELAYDVYTIVCTTWPTQKMKLPIKDFFSKCNQIHSFPRIWSHLLKKSFMKNFIFCAAMWTFDVRSVLFLWPVGMTWVTL